MECIRCGSERTRKDGQTRLGGQRWRCNSCGRRFTVRSTSAFSHHGFADDVIALATACPCDRAHIKTLFRLKCLTEDELVHAAHSAATEPSIGPFAHSGATKPCRVLKEYVRYFNGARPHQGINQRMPDREERSNAAGDRTGNHRLGSSRWPPSRLSKSSVSGCEWMAKEGTTRVLARPRERDNGAIPPVLPALPLSRPHL